MKYITRGSFESCLADFFRRFGKTKELAAFAQVAPDSVKRWANKNYLPTGVTRIKAIFFLELIGYGIDDLKSIPEAVCMSARLLAFDIITGDTIKKSLGLPRKLSRYYSYLWGEMKPGRDRIHMLNLLVAEHSAALIAITRTRRDEFKHLHVHESEPATASYESASQEDTEQLAAAAVPGSPSEPQNGLDTRLIQAFASACACIRHLGEQFLAGSEEQRKALRRHMHRNPQQPELHNTWHVLHQLMKERRSDS